MPFLTHLMKFLAVMLFTISAVFAKTHTIEMRNASSDDPNVLNVFTPSVLRVEKGDTVRFVMIDKAHNSASKRGMVPDGTEGWNGAIDEEIEVTLDVEGTYGYLCLPHYEMGMVGLILVGDYKSNYKKAKKVRHSGSAKKAFRQLFEQIESEERALEASETKSVKQAVAETKDQDDAHKH